MKFANCFKHYGPTLPRGVSFTKFEDNLNEVVTHETEKPSLATKLDNFVIDSNRSFATHFRSLGFDP